jgi:hypothetical protein
LPDYERRPSLRSRLLGNLRFILRSVQTGSKGQALATYEKRNSCCRGLKNLPGLFIPQNCHVGQMFEKIFFRPCSIVRRFGQLLLTNQLQNLIGRYISRYDGPAWHHHRRRQVYPQSFDQFQIIINDLSLTGRFGNGPIHKAVLEHTH